VGASYTSSQNGGKDEGRKRARLIKNLVDPAKLPVIVDEHRIERRVRRLQSWIDQLTFPRIFALWFFVIFCFGLVYFYAQTPQSYLWSVLANHRVDNLSDAVYYSFITATTLGYGDIVPLGGFRVLAIAEVVCGWLLLAMLTARLISIKQDIIIGELYEASIRSEITGLRTSLRHFRQKMDEFITHLEEGTLRKRSVNDLYRNLASFEENLIRIRAFIPEEKSRDFKKNPEEEDMEILLNGILNSFEKIDELMRVNIQDDVIWRTESTIGYLKTCLDICESIFIRANKSNLFKPEALEAFNIRKDKVFSSIISEINVAEVSASTKTPENK
jgi:hypothetical protein